MSGEIMIPVDSACIPEGYQAQRFGYGEIGETVVQHDRSGVSIPTIIHSYSPKFPRLIICKKYNPGIPLPKDWWVWRDGDAWIATPGFPNHYSSKCIHGLDWLPGFIPPSDGQPRQIK